MSNDNVPVFHVNGSTYYAGGDYSNCTLAACPIDSTVYGYRPSVPFSAALIALYGLCLAAQLVLGYRYKTWGFMTAMVLGCIVEVLGYAGRIMMHDDPWGDSGFTMQIVLITIGPVFFSAAVYVMLAQIAHYISASASRFRPALFYWVFIPCDIMSLILQAIGGAMSSTSNGSSTAGVNIALAGLAFQVATLVFFIAAAIDYATRSRSIWSTVHLPISFKIFISFLTAATVLILIRCCYRVYELSEGYTRNSEALRDQPLFIGLEGVMVVVAAWCLVAGHPGPALKRGERPAAFGAADAQQEKADV